MKTSATLGTGRSIVPVEAFSTDPGVPRGRRPVLCCLMVVAASLTPLQAMQGPADSYEAVYDALAALQPTTQQAVTKDVEFVRESATFRLTDGIMHTLSPVNGRTPGIVFAGLGTFKFEPAIPVEREALERRVGSPVLEVSIRGVVFLFGDSTLEQLSAQTPFVEGGVERQALGYVREMLGLLLDKRSKSFHEGALSTFLNGHRDDMFCAYVIADSGPFFFEVAAHEFEQVRLMMKARRGERRGELEVVSQFRSAASRRSVELPGLRDILRVDRYVLNATVMKDLEFFAAAKLELQGKLPGYAWVPFNLYSGLTVDSVTSGDGSPVTFFRGKDDATVWIHFTPALASGDARAMQFYYHGDLISEQASWYYLHSSVGWYPRYLRAREPTAFDLTFTYPDGLTLVAVGDKVGETREERNITGRWVTDLPIRYASFNVGRFTTYELNYPGIPKIVVLKQQEGHENLPTEFLTGAGMEHDVGKDIANAMTFFESTFGKPAADHISATEIPFGHGQGFPGLLHLSYGTFWDEKQVELNELFRAHEVAHQWWGNGVSFRTYRDRWLDEGLADYAALLFLRHVVRKPNEFDDVLEEYRKEILKRASQAGPIDLGHRNATSDSPDDYSTIVYKKGAWVAHMLRGMMMEPGSENDGAFLAMMHEFYTAHRGGLVSTNDLQQVAERHFGTGMWWFFDEWVRGTAIPTYEFAYQVESTSDSGFALHVRVEQKDVPESFVMFVPLSVEFPDGSSQWFRLAVKDTITKGVIQLAREPKEVTFNAGNAVLARTKSVRW